MNTLYSEARKDRLVQEQMHDAYPHSSKLAEPNVCPVCSAVFKGGHWQWVDSWSLESHQEICQACRRIRDNDPAGFVTMSGDFMESHKQEVINLARNEEAAECSRHPLNRIMSIEDHGNLMIVATTDIHLPKRIGSALHRAYKGEMDLHYDKQGCFVRVNWTSRASEENKPNSVKKRR